MRTGGVNSSTERGLTLLSLRAIFLVVAVILFVLSAVGLTIPRVNLTALGLAFFSGAFLV